MLIVGNWKAYVEKRALAKSLYDAAKKLSASGKHSIVIGPAAPYIGMIAPGNRSAVAVACQDVSDTTGGAETAEVTAAAYADIGVTYAIVGHSERRAKGDTDEIVSSKVQHALAHGLIPILCVGEHERDADATYLKKLRMQIASVLQPLSPKERLSVVIAYEPLWAIGPSASGAITPDDLQQMILYIRKVLAEFVPGRANEKARILYGGSVDAENASSLTAGTGVDGLLIGRASTNPATFVALVKAIR